jgi:hypothetical protein
MRSAAFVIISLASSCFWFACDETTTDPGPAPDPALADGGALLDANAPAPPTDDGAVIAPIPFDAGFTPAPTCKGLFELCSGQECCAPNICQNGTCR